MRRWEWVFPIAAIVLPLWATIPDLAHFCGWLEFSRMCGLGAIFRFDVLVPATFPIALWALVRTFFHRHRWEAIYGGRSQQFCMDCGEERP